MRDDLAQIAAAIPFPFRAAAAPLLRLLEKIINRLEEKI